MCSLLLAVAALPFLDTYGYFGSLLGIRYYNIEIGLVQAAALVIASHQKSGLAEFLLGSVAAHCTAHSRRPVLVLHAPMQQAQQHSGPGVLDRLASAATAALGGRAEQQATAAEPAALSSQGSSCSLQRHIVLPIDDSGVVPGSCRAQQAAISGCCPLECLCWRKASPLAPCHHHQH
jgi:hypothetical protein